jgi:hypothetical protein
MIATLPKFQTLAKFASSIIMPRNKKYWQRRFGYLADVDAYYNHLNLMHVDDLDDEAFAYLISPVKGVDMLDLNETEISNDSIKLLTGLEYVKELRVKGCHKIDDACVSDLNKITSLELLHLKNTSVTIDGILKLNQLTRLKKILFSADDADAIKEKMLQLKTILPGCDFVINSKPYYFDTRDRFIYALKKQPYTYRLKIKNESLDAPWSNWLGRPGDNYIEAEKQGPYSLHDIEWIEINPVEKRKEGKLIPEKELDHSAAIIKLLGDLSFPFMVTDRIISVYVL